MSVSNYGYPNLAIDRLNMSQIRRNTGTAADELRCAGASIQLVGDDEPNGEVMAGLRGEIHADGAVVVFRRAWSYWRVNIKNGRLPLAAATALHESAPIGVYGRDSKAVRVNGHCGSPAPEEDVSYWHVDTPDGMRLLVEALVAGLRPDQRTPDTWWPEPPSTRRITETVLEASDPDAASDRGWDWARSTRDAAVREGSGRWHAAWNAAAQVCLALWLCGFKPTAGADNG